MEINQETKNTGRIVKILKIISFIPLIIYPFVLLANIMSFSGEQSGDKSLSKLVAMYAFVILSTLYPATVIFSLVANKSQKIIIALLPFLHLLIIALVLFLWSLSS